MAVRVEMVTDVEVAPAGAAQRQRFGTLSITHTSSRSRGDAAVLGDFDSSLLSR